MNKEEEYKAALESILKISPSSFIQGICMGALGLGPKSIPIQLARLFEAEVKFK